MLLTIFLTLSLVSVQFTAGDEPCKVRGILTNSLKCGDQVYTRSQKYLDIIKTCSPGIVGELITLKMAMCMFGTYNVPGVTDPLDAMKQDFLKDLGAHGPQLVELAEKCFVAAKYDAPDSTKIVECTYEGYQKICGYKSCNWLNNVD